ncbi:MAG: hypothetical protein M3Y82_02160 [Verrucomicrobiota bacterium]|nr:hypothetical protein [Verrucomicrobiota bacterium]
MKATLEPKEKFLVDAAGKRIAVMLDLATYDRLRVKGRHPYKRYYSHALDRPI